MNLNDHFLASDRTPPMHQTTRALHFCQIIRRSVFSFLLYPISLIGLLLILLLVYNGFYVFCVHLPFPAKSSPERANITAEILSGEPVQKIISLPSPSTISKLPSSSSSSSSSSLMFAAKEENPPAVLKTHLHLVEEPNLSIMPVNTTLSLVKPSRRPRKNHTSISKVVISRDKSRRLVTEVKDFLAKSSCRLWFFMTWISSIESFGERELFAVESLFKSHPSGCLILVSDSLDSERGRSLILRPFLDKGFKIMAVNPDFDHIFKDTHAEIWYDQLKRGKIHPGEIPVEQNLSNLLRLVLLYKFGGVYIDTDVIILKSFSRLRNVIGAQTIDYKTRNWSRLNNAVLIFDKKHPLLYRFIEEFFLTFNGNKWGHNGPYLVSRVAARVSSQAGLNFSVMPPQAFYPVDWNRIGSFFRAPLNESDSKWLNNKLDSIRRQSFAIHLWNRQSKKHRVEEGSIIHHIMLDSCIFCNSSSHSSL